MESRVIFSQYPDRELEALISRFQRGKIFLLTEEIPDRFCLPVVETISERHEISKIVIPGGEMNKSIESVVRVWEFLSQSGADRKSLLINIGGGMLTDLGGFAASTFKRGIAFINIPTTLLAQVDASIGGKTGINFNGLKNEIGVFREPDAVLIHTGFLKTIDRENFLSGYAEMIKHGLIKSPEHWHELQEYDPEHPDYEKLEQIIGHSVDIKKWHVLNDPTEKNIRKALNFGHTAGHAFESHALHKGKPILHGYAVAYGMIAELYLSFKKTGFGEPELKSIARWLRDQYGWYAIAEEDYKPLYELMTHDKKNEGARINFTLLSSVGRAVIDQDCTRELIFEAFDYYRSLE